MDKASHLSVILDLSPTQWHLLANPQTNQPPSQPFPLSAFLAQLLAFLNAHIACKDENSLAVFGALPGKSVMLYSTTLSPDEVNSEPADADTYRPFKVLDSTVMQSILRQFDELGVPTEEEPIGLVGALTKALCYINRVTNPLASSALATNSSISLSQPALATLPDPRILIMSVSPDQSASYIPIMNSIFSAQKLKITIDVCKIYGSDSVFLQQAAHLTGGSYVTIERPESLLQYLTMSFLPPPALRQLISVPTQEKIDFRAACFCHKHIVDIGFVCSVCLSIFCQPVPVCSTCKTKFPIKTLQRLNAAKPAPPGGTSRPSGTSTPSTPKPNNIASPRPASGPPAAGGNPNALPRSTSIGLGRPTGANSATSAPTR